MSLDPKYFSNSHQDSQQYILQGHHQIAELHQHDHQPTAFMQSGESDTRHSSTSISPSSQFEGLLSETVELCEAPIYMEVFQSKDYPEAIRQITQIIEGTEGGLFIPDHHINRGIAYLLNNQPKLALADFLVANQSPVVPDEISLLMGLAYQEEGQTAEAVKCFEEALAHPKTHVEAAFELCKINYLNLDFHKIETHYYQLYQTGNEELHLELARFVIDDLYKKVINHNSDPQGFVIAYEILAYLRQELGDNPASQLLNIKYEILNFAATKGKQSAAYTEALEQLQILASGDSPLKSECIELSKITSSSDGIIGLLWFNGFDYFRSEVSVHTSHSIEHFLLKDIPILADDDSLRTGIETQDLVSLYTDGDEQVKEHISKAYKAVATTLLHHRQENTYQLRFCIDSGQQKGGKAPPLELNYGYVGDIFRDFHELIQNENDDEVSSYYYPVITHVIENFMPELIMAAGEKPQWFIDLENKDELLAEIIMEKTVEADGIVQSGSTNKSPFVLNLYYLQNAFLKSIGNHLDTFLSPDKKLLEKNEYLTYSYQKNQFRIGLKPFIVRYNDSGWPESVHYDRKAVGCSFLEDTCNTASKLRPNHDHFYWLTTNETYRLFEHIQTNGLTYTNGSITDNFSLIPEIGKPTKPTRADDKAPSTEEEETSGKKKKSTSDKPREPGSKKSSTTTTGKQQLIDDIFGQLESTSHEGDFLSSLSIGSIKGLNMLHKKVAEQQARIDAQCTTKVLTCAHSELLKQENIDVDQIPVYLNVDGFYQLKQYQKDSLARILNLKHKGIPGAILGLEMGLGKTLVMAELLMHLFKDQSAPVLFLCPRNVMAQSVEKLQEYLVIAQLGQLELQLDRAKQISEKKAFMRTMGAIGVYLGHLGKLGLKSDMVLGKILRMKSDIQTIYSEKSVLRPWSPPIFDDCTGRIDQETINNIFNGDDRNSEGCHLLSIHPTQDIYSPKPNEILNASLSNQRKVIIYNNDAVSTVVTSRKSKGLENVAWSGLFIDEAQSLHNIEKETHKGVKALINRVSSKVGTPPFVLLSTGTPYQNYDGDPYALLSLTEPRGQFESGSGEVFTVERMQRLIEEKHQDVKAKLTKYTTRSTLGTRAQNYHEFQTAFLQYVSLVENFKKILNEVCIIVKREDVKDQWNGLIPDVITMDDNLTLDDSYKRQKRELERLSNEFHDNYNQEMGNSDDLRNSMERAQSSSSAGGSKKKSFLEFVGQVSRTIVHPSFSGRNNSERLNIANKIARSDTSAEKVKRWVNQSILLSNLLSDDFGEEMRDGSIIFVDEIATGRAIQECIKKLYPRAEQVDFLQGATKVQDRQRMVDTFESNNPRRNQRVLIIMAQSGCAGTDLRTKGKTAHICYFDFNPGNIEQAKSRIIRANSPKDQVKIVYYNIEGLYFCECVKRHRTRKMAMEQYIFQPQTAKDASLTELTQSLLEILMLECSIDPKSRKSQELVGKLGNYISENSERLQRGIDKSSAVDATPVRFTRAAPQRASLPVEGIQIFPVPEKQKKTTSSRKDQLDLTFKKKSLPPIDDLPSFSFKKRKEREEQKTSSSSDSRGRVEQTESTLTLQERDSKRQRRHYSGGQGHSFERYNHIAPPHQMSHNRKRERSESPSGGLYQTEPHTQRRYFGHGHYQQQRTDQQKRQKTFNPSRHGNRHFQHSSFNAGSSTSQQQYFGDMLSRKRTHEESHDRGHVRVTEVEPGEIVESNPHSKRQKVHDFNRSYDSGRVRQPRLTMDQNISRMSTFYSSANIGSHLITDCKILVEGSLWAIIPVERNAECFDFYSGVLSGNNIIQAVACGMNFFDENRDTFFNRVLPDLTAEGHLPLQARISVRSIRSRNGNLWEWLRRVHVLGSNPPRTFEEVRQHLASRGYSLIIHRFDRDAETNNIVEKREVAVQGSDSSKEIHLLESKVNGISHYDLLTRFP